MGALILKYRLLAETIPEDVDLEMEWGVVTFLKKKQGVRVQRR